MVDLIVKKPSLTRQELLARGAFEVDHNAPTPGFAGFDREFSNPTIDPSLQKEIDDELLRGLDQKPTQGQLEALGEVRELNLDSEKVKEAQWLDQEELATYRQGRIIHCKQFLAMLKRIRPDATYADVAIVGRREVLIREDGKLKHAGTVQNGPMIEWSQMRLDAHHIPTNERYLGWRSVLMNLIRKDMVSEDRVHRVFGHPASSSPRAEIWYRQLYMHRNNRCPVCTKQLCICKGRYQDLHV